MTLKIRLLLEEKLGRRVRYPKDCDGLAWVIRETVGDRISSSTLKRIFGFIEPPGTPSLYTLDIISRFLGYSDWEHLQKNLDSLEEPNPKLISGEPLILRSEDIDDGHELEIGYFPESRLVLYCIGKALFRVTESVNTFLFIDDILEIHMFSEKCPLQVNSVIRDQENLGPWIAARLNGVDFIRVRNDHSSS